MQTVIQSNNESLRSLFISLLTSDHQTPSETDHLH